MVRPEVLVGGPIAAGSPLLSADSPLNLITGIVAGGGFALFLEPGSAGEQCGPVRAVASKSADGGRPGPAPAVPADHFVAVDLRDVVLGGHRDPLPVAAPLAPAPRLDEEPATVLVSPGEGVAIPEVAPVVDEPSTVLAPPVEKAGGGPAGGA